eukprot:CAMPEP_0119354912 /NCGR_PEP_ID=MMETSP1334-20130426/3882_1 /TAXON_ID=127549 /ORGANISM="Calcidiscus leptoporus, Strain RCC1130" /LENGTH=53 /DNA_ID=CAMNT_0007368621 /DNA_START=762 /DNA_END=924 /DNA_ORIENTATION=-
MPCGNSSSGPKDQAIMSVGESGGVGGPKDHAMWKDGREVCGRWEDGGPKDHAV